MHNKLKETRTVVNATTDTVVQRTMYYASGVPMAENLMGNMAASVMGSFEFSWEKTGVDYNGNAIVVCHLSNPMSAKSLLKVPLIGYTDFWRENVGNKINAYFNSEANETGIMQTVKINMTWTEIIPKSN